MKSEETYIHSAPRPDVCVLVVGFNRSLEQCLPSVFTYIIGPLKKNGIRVELVGQISVASKVLKNSRLGSDIGRTEPWLASHILNQFDSISVREAGSITRSTLLAFSICAVFGDPWPETRFRSLRNHLHFLRLLDESHKQIEHKNYTAVIVVRSDLTVLSAIDAKKVIYASDNSNSVLTPYWHNWGFTNDRIAILGRATYKNYLKRINQIPRFLLERRRKLHGETFLDYCLEEFDNRKTLEILAARTRLGGQIVNENFSAHLDGFFMRP